MSRFMQLVFTQHTGLCALVYAWDSAMHAQLAGGAS